MLDQIATDLWSNVETVFLSGDYISIGIAVLAALIMTFAMSSYNNIINTTVGALVLFGVAQVIRNVAMAGPDTTPETAISNSWDSFMAVSMGVLVVYFIAFFLVISIFFIIKSAIQR